MQSLEFLYEQVNKNQTYFERKISIFSKKTLLKGCRKSGKTYLIFDYLQNFDEKEYLYIDLKDERIDIREIELNLESFIVKNSIQLLIIENYTPSFLLPKVEEIILSSQKNSLSLVGFEEITLYPLDFEEFISFDRRHFNIEHIFNIYANQGTFPQVVLDNEHNAHKNLQELMTDIIEDKAKFLIYKKLSELQSTKVSLFQIYNQLKTTIKISKDTLYKSVEELEDEGLLYLVKKFGSTKSSKKVFLIDFAIKNALSLKKDFLKRLENMVFIELIKKSYEVFYTDKLDLYIPEKKLGIICAPFSLEENIEKRLKKDLPHIEELGITSIEIISIGNEALFRLEDKITCKILPFWEWSLQS